MLYSQTINIGENGDQKRTPAVANSYHFLVEATGALAHRYHASTPFDKLSPYSSRFIMQRAVIPKICNKYQEISEKRRPVPTIASGLVAIKVIWFAIRQRPFDLRIRVAANSGGRDCYTL